MTIYLTIITTVLVLTQVIRLMQNAIQLRGMKEMRETNRDLMNDWIEVIERLHRVLDDKVIE